MNKLQEAIQDLPHIKTVYINKSGDWHFHPQPGFDPVSREEVLSQSPEKTEEEPVHEDGPSTGGATFYKKRKNQA